MSFEIGKTLETDQPFSLEISHIVTDRTFIASVTRYGKSWTTRKIVEEAFGHAGIIIIDAEGEYSSLREAFPFLIIGKDIPLQIETAEFMAEKTLENKISVIIDVSMVEDDEAGKEYIDLFLRHFFHLETVARQPYLVVVEEAEEYIPESGSPATRTTLATLINYAKRGGKRGIGLMLVAHRPAWVSKGVISQCGNKAVGRIAQVAQDLDVLEKYAQIPSGIISKLPNLGKGEFYFSGDWVKESTFVKVGSVKTQHLGFTPSVIPPSPGDLQKVIEGLQRSLPEVRSKLEKTSDSVEAVKKQVRDELEAKFHERIQVIEKGADDRAGKRYQKRVDELTEQLGKLSRSQALQPTMPLTDVLEHPIVQARLLELPEKAREILVKVEREPGVSREQLAAFQTASKDQIASQIDRINRVFRATVIVGEGKPIRYHSMLKRLYLTDVAKREIEEIRNIQADNKQKADRISELESQVQTLHSTAQQDTALRNELEEERRLKERFKKDFEDTEGKWKSALLLRVSDVELLEGQIAELKKENSAYQKLKEALSVLSIINSGSTAVASNIDLDEEKVRALIDESVDEKVKERIKEAIAALPLPLSPAAVVAVPPGGSTSVEYENKLTHFDYKEADEHITADKTTVKGRIIFLVLQDFFAVRHNRKQIVEELSNRGWIEDPKEVDSALLELCSSGIFTRKISTGNAFWFALTDEAKELVREA
jgi:hypothetical protein